MNMDQQLWNDFKAGKKSALQEIYKTHARALLQYGARFTSNNTLVEDAIHDLFVELYQRRTKLGDTDNIRCYLLVALRRKIIKTTKKRSKIIDFDQSDNYSFTSELAIEDMIIHAELDQEQRENLKQAFTKLSPRQKEIIYLKYHMNEEYEEICQILNINYQSARNLLTGALTKLRKNMSKVFFIFFFFLSVQFHIQLLII